MLRKLTTPQNPQVINDLYALGKALSQGDRERWIVEMELEFDALSAIETWWCPVDLPLRRKALNLDGKIRTEQSSATRQGLRYKEFCK